MKFIIYLASFSLLLSSCSNDDKTEGEESENREETVEKNESDEAKDIKEDSVETVVSSNTDIDYLIDDGGVGPVKLGVVLEKEDIPDTYVLESKEVDMGEGEKGIIKYLKTADSDKIMLSFTQDCSEGENCVADRIFVNDANFKTSTGIGVGSSVKDLKKFYTISMALGNEYGNVYIYTEEVPNIGFEILGMADVYPGKDIAISDIDDQTIISKVYLYQQ